jgi:hypothetical protein
MEDAFGIVAMVAMTPLIIIQIIGLIYNRKLKKIAIRAEQEKEAMSEAISAEDAGNITLFVDPPGLDGINPPDGGGGGFPSKNDEEVPSHG